MAINYDFIAYCSKISPTNWVIGMKGLYGEVPLDIVIPNEKRSSDADEPEIVGVVTTEGIARESTDGLELYRYLRQLNPKKNDVFGYNEVVIRNIHGHLNNLRVNEELRVQITYTQRKEPYTTFAYHIKLLGIFQKSDAEASTDATDETDTPHTQQTLFPEQTTPQNNPEQQIYKTTNTLEKLITFTQNIQEELKQTKRDLAAMVDKVEKLEHERQHFREMQNVVQEVLAQLSELETIDARIQHLETDQHQFQDFQQSLQKFLVVLSQQSRVLLQDEDG
ncbi:hypothetical protein J5I95_24765 [Candidatus Poribacteria bacterium]|nr:hypothetical protein [Candidatus Poribacteria bacterium]